jgi:hypothetical protein
MKDTPSAALTVSESSCATGRSDETGGSEAFGAETATEEPGVGNSVAGGPETSPLPVGLGIGDLLKMNGCNLGRQKMLGLFLYSILDHQSTTHATGGPETTPLPVGLGIGDLLKRMGAIQGVRKYWVCFSIRFSTTKITTHATGGPETTPLPVGLGIGDL